MFHVFALNAGWRYFLVDLVCNVPNLALLVCSDSAKHAGDVRAESRARASLPMRLDCEDGLVELARVEPIKMAAFRRYHEVVFVRWMPSGAFNVLTDGLVQLVLERRLFLSHVDDVELSVVPSRQEDLFIEAIPFDCLDLVGVEVGVSSFAFEFIQVPDPHRVVSRP